MFNENDVITDGAQTATVKYSSEAFLVAGTDNGDEFVLNANQLDGWNLASEAEAPFAILHPFVVYRLDGTRVDGYADRARAERRGRKFCPQGFMLVDSNTAEVTRIG